MGAVTTYQDPLRMVQRVARQVRASPSPQTGSVSEWRSVDANVTRAVLLLDNTWREFMRTLVLSACHEPRLANGGNVKIDPRYRSSANFKAKIYDTRVAGKPTMRLHPKWGVREPNWQNRKTVERLLKAIGFSEVGRVRAAGAYAAAAFPTANPVEDLASARNFYAHRNEETAWKLKRKLRRNYSMGVEVRDHPTDLLVRNVPFAAGTPLDVWATAIEKTAEEMVLL